jgi:DNA-directed RNA polymerase subunit F
MPNGPAAGTPAAAAQPASSGVLPGGMSGANARAGTPRAAANSPAKQQQGNLPAGWMNRLQQMSPEERERFLQNNQKFQSLPPEQQKAIRDRFAQWNKLTPEQRQNMEKNAQALAQLTPEQRQAVRTQLLPQWRQLTPDRRQEIKQRLNSLNGLNDAERNQKLNDPNFYQGLSPQEHNVLKQMGQLKLSPGAGGE